MKAALFIGKPLFELREVPDPHCPAGGLVVRVQTCAMCGTDLKIMKCQDVKIEKGKAVSMELPRITGHELSGIVEEADNAGSFKPGNRVVVAPTIPCLNCPMCKRGYHLFDEVQSVAEHCLYCDACHLEIHIDQLSMILKTTRCLKEYVKENRDTPNYEILERLESFTGKGHREIMDLIETTKESLPK